MAMASSALASLGHFFKDPLRTMITNSHIRTDEPQLYSLKFRLAGRDTKTRSSCVFHHQLTNRGYLLLDHPELELLGSHRLCGCQGRQGGVLLQPALVWSRRGRALHGIP